MAITTPIDFTGLWRNLPYSNDVSYTSVNTHTGDLTTTLSDVVVTPHTRDEGDVSYGKYVKWKTTFKIPKEIWSVGANTSITHDDANWLSPTISAGSIPAGDYQWTVYPLAYGPSGIFVVGTGVTFGEHFASPKQIELNFTGSEANFLLVRAEGLGPNFNYVYQTLSGSGTVIDNNTGWTTGQPTTNTSPFSLGYPKTRDRITVEGTTWTVETAIDGTRDQSLYRLACNRLVIQLALNDVVQVYSQGTATDSYLFKAIDTPTQTYTDQVCAIQPVEPEWLEPDEFQRKHGITQKYTIHMQNQINISFGDIMVDQNNITYQVQGWKNKNRVDELQEIYVEIKP